MTGNPGNLESKLFNIGPTDMSEKEVDLLWGQYKLYVEMMDKVSKRRHHANSFFLTVNTALIAVLTGFVSLTQQPLTQLGWILAAAITGVVFCLTWRRLIESYRQLNTGKFKIVHLLEKRLPANLFDAEWEALNHGDGTVYRPFNRMERWVPAAFAAVYGAMVLLVLLDSVF